MTKTATITLSRRQWAEIVEQFRLYSAATPSGKLVPEWMEALNGICRGIGAKLPSAGDTMDLTGPWVKWWHCSRWCLLVSCCGTAGGLAEIGAMLAAQLAAQDVGQGVPATEAA